MSVHKRRTGFSASEEFWGGLVKVGDAVSSMFLVPAVKQPSSLFIAGTRCHLTIRVRVSDLPCSPNRGFPHACGKTMLKRSGGMGIEKCSRICWPTTLQRVCHIISSSPTKRTQLVFLSVFTARTEQFSSVCCAKGLLSLDHKA